MSCKFLRLEFQLSLASPSPSPSLLFFSRSFFGPENRLVTLKLVKYSLLMLIAPLATFYFFFVVVFKSNHSMLGWAGMAAVVATNLVIAAYVVMAFTENDEEMSKVNNSELHKQGQPPPEAKKSD